MRISIISKGIDIYREIEKERKEVKYYINGN